MSIDARWLPVERGGHRWDVLVVAPSSPRRLLLWLPALGVPARNYEPFARSLAQRGVAVVVHEWRGFGASSLRASHECDWGYRELLTVDIPATHDLAAGTFPGLPVTIGGHSLGASWPPAAWRSIHGSHRRCGSSPAAHPTPGRSPGPIDPGSRWPTACSRSWRAPSAPYPAGASASAGRKRAA